MKNSVKNKKNVAHLFFQFFQITLELLNFPILLNVLLQVISHIREQSILECYMPFLKNARPTTKKKLNFFHRANRVIYQLSQNRRIYRTFSRTFQVQMKKIVSSYVEETNILNPNTVKREQKVVRLALRFAISMDLIRESSRVRSKGLKENAEIFFLQLSATLR